MEGCGITVHPKRTFIGEIGYFIDERFWGRGIATQAVKILEKTGFQELGLERIEILMDPQNIASEKVVVKCSYSKEGTMKKGIKNRNYFSDAHLYAKVKDSYTADN